MNTKPNVQTEVELKFPLSDRQAVRARLVELGFTSAGRVYEYNLVLDTPEGELSLAGKLLRLRRDRKVRLTFKERLAGNSALDERYKVRAESEIELSDLETMRHVLHRLGYTRERVYEKYREHFSLGAGVSAELDTLPLLGDVLELEAPPQEIDSLAAQLGLEVTSGLRENYLQLFSARCLALGREPGDMRFALDPVPGGEPES
ncbi:class IV adenylate cyclase [bacterium]|nr:class IV adenylate cyclase [bacterium]